METPVQKPISELSEALEALGTDKLLIQTANGTKIIVWSSKGSAPDNAKLVFTPAE